MEDAGKNSVTKESQTLLHIDWFEVKQVRGHLEDGKITDGQVTVKLGFRLEEH